MTKVLITTIPFGEISKDPLNILEEAGIEIVRNPYGRRMTEDELRIHIADVDYFIAGLDTITSLVLDSAPKLKIISRVGVGLDNVPFNETNKRGIKVTYTPDPTTQPVAELIMGFLIDCARRFTFVDKEIRVNKWHKYMGSLIKGKTIGIIGVGRIGKTLVKLLQPFEAEIICNDIKEDPIFAKRYKMSYVDKDEIYARSDFLSLNLNYSPEVRHLINKETLSKMKTTSCVINTSRGPVVNEKDLYDALKNNKLAGAALDVFEQEPYKGELKSLSNVILTAHIGAATKESRILMESQAVEEVIRFHNGEQLKYEIDHN